MNKKFLHKLPAWLVMSPWLAVGCAVVLAGCVLLYDMINGKRERSFTIQITQEKGQALINTLESALQLGIGQNWTHDELEILLENSSSQEDIIILAITDEDGQISFSGRPELIGSLLFPKDEQASLKPTKAFQWQIADWNNKRVFFVFKEFSQKIGRENHGHDLKEHNSEADYGSAVLSRSEPLIIFVGYDMSQIEDAELTDRSHTIITSAILTFLALVAGLTIFLVRGYQRSRNVVLETTAFSSEMLATLPVGIIATDMDNRVTSANPEALKIMGLDSNEVMGTMISDIIPSVWPMLDEKLAAGGFVRDLETRCHFKEGQYVPLAVGSSRIITDDGKPIGNVLILRDLGEIRDLQAELRLKERLSAIGTLAAGVAHEIKNPLSAIRGFAKYFMESNQPDSTDAKMARTLEQEVMRLNKVVGDLLDYARPDNLVLGSFTLNDLIFQAERMVSQQLDAQGIEFEANLPEPPLTLTADKDKLAQVILNLFINSIQAMQKSTHKRLTVTGKVVKQARKLTPLLLLEIADTGSGIPADILEDIFSLYFTTKARGTGLGLPIVHKIIEAHGGHIEVKSVPDQGSSFIIHLPLHDHNGEDI